MKLMCCLLLFTAYSAFAVTQDNPYEIKTLELYRQTDQGLKAMDDQDPELKTEVVKSDQLESPEGLTTSRDLPGVSPDGQSDPTPTVGEVIAVAEKIIALGEKIYALVDKGRPTTEFNYAPISIVPKTDKNAPADVLMEMGGGSMPKVENFHIIAKNGFKRTVIDFEFTLLFFHSMTYKGAGAYITAAQMIPKNVVVNWGFDFSATMKLNGIVNHGSSMDPVAGAILVLEYDIKNAVKYTKKSAIFHITGKGEVFNY